ncbi:hypothetical protein SOVF_175980 [Spinacia oleracea]|nr:hypothetical protein SOVF_175980 [Spinacia oleracea]
MASLSLPKHSLISTLPTQTQTRKPISSQNLCILSNATQSQFCGLKLSHTSPLSSPFTSRSSKLSVIAKVKEGTLAPAFSLKDQDGRNVSLSKFKGKPVVVYFYPADESPGCTKQVLTFISLPIVLLFFV